MSRKLGANAGFREADIIMFTATCPLLVTRGVKWSVSLGDQGIDKFSTKAPDQEFGLKGRILRVS